MTHDFKISVYLNKKIPGERPRDGVNETLR